MSAKHIKSRQPKDKSFIKFFSTHKIKLSISLAVTVVFFIVILPLNEHVAFTQPYLDHGAETLALILKAVAFPVFFGLFYFIVNFIDQVRLKNKGYISWGKHFLAYLGVMVVLLLLLYPGHWVGDEFQILNVVQDYSLYSWQNYFTNIFYTLSLYLIPTGVGIVIVQITIISLIVGYIISTSRELFRQKYTHLLLFIPFLFFPVLLNNLYPLRITLVSYILLLVIALLIFLYKGIVRPSHPKLFFLQAATLIALISFWRSEAIIYLTLLPLYAFKLDLLSKESLRKGSTYILFLFSILIILLFYGVVKITTSDKYQITATLNPLSTIIQGEGIEDRNKEELDKIGKVLNLDIIKKYPSYIEIPSFWHGGVKDDYYLYLDGYNREVYKLILSNPSLFLENRVQTFMATNSFYPSPSLGMSQFFNNDPAVVGVLDKFYQTNYASKPINPDLKLRITRMLLTLDHKNETTPVTKIVWSIIPTILLLFALFIYAIIKRQWLLLYLSFLLICHSCIIFFTAPASYFMYYFPIYLSGNSILFAIALIKINEKHTFKALGRTTSGRVKI